jgi:carbon-monoxide dehydrogenase small subunit
VRGACGACTVLFNGEAARACIMFAVQADGADIVTVEGIARGSALHPLQAAFHQHHGLQCGFCTPGMLMTLEAYLRDHPAPTRDEIRDVLSGNICRCTGYEGIVDAAMQAAEARRPPR